MQADFVAQLKGWKGDARLYQLDTPYQVTDWEGDPEGDPVTQVIVSGVVALGRPETYIFPARDGSVVSYGELPGSFQGAIDHQRAIDGFCQAVG